MPGNKWDEARNAEVAMLFAFIDILKDGGKMTDFEGVAAKLGEGFTEAGVRFVSFRLIFRCHSFLSLHLFPAPHHPTFFPSTSSNFSFLHISLLPLSHTQGLHSLTQAKLTLSNTLPSPFRQDA